MQSSSSGFTLAGLLLLIPVLTLGGYFTFAAVQGDFGVFRRVQINADSEVLRLERDQLAANLSVLQNLTRRLSDDYLDLELLDEQVRNVLGYLRTDEIVVR